LERTVGLGTVLYAGAFGLIYLALGLGEVASGLRLVEIAYIPSDIFGGAMCALIGVIFLRGIEPLSSGRVSGLSFFLVGIMMASIYSVLYILILGAHGLGSLIGMVEYEVWSPLDDFRPEVWLPLLALPAVMILRSKLGRRPFQAPSR